MVIGSKTQFCQGKCLFAITEYAAGFALAFALVGWVPIEQSFQPSHRSHIVVSFIFGFLCAGHRVLGRRLPYQTLVKNAESWNRTVIAMKDISAPAHVLTPSTFLIIAIRYLLGVSLGSFAVCAFLLSVQAINLPLPQRVGQVCWAVWAIPVAAMLRAATCPRDISIEAKEIHIRHFCGSRLLTSIDGALVLGAVPLFLPTELLLENSRIELIQGLEAQISEQ